ncbi:MAG: tetratricopeptide repeat protein, partial [Candidatus Sabulitectum sp.]|nr:tetratricopeptide repeat protein [Candidatus Sabulitectum sp.]
MNSAASPKKSFFGRERELSELTDSLMDPECRILTITGIGGIGKTTLALRLAEKMQSHFRNGFCFIPLADLEHSGQVAPAIISKLGFIITHGDLARLLPESLRNKNILLVLDNFEHLVSAALLLERIGLAAENVKLLVTSRARLNIAGETIYELSGMHIPVEESPEVLLSSAPVRLFLSNPEVDGRLDLEDLKVVVQICREVDGVPLGIVLASSWLHRMSPLEILSEISEGSRFLQRETPIRERRHSSLRRVFDYSWMLLTKGERITFSEISIFRGCFNVEAVEFITGSSRDSITGLRNKSLLQTEAAGRFSLHPLLHDFSTAKLENHHSRREALFTRHAEYYCRLLTKNEKAIFSEDSAQAMEEITENLSDIRAAVAYSTKMKMTEAIIACSKALKNYFMRTGLLEEGFNVFKDVSIMLKDINFEESLIIKIMQASFASQMTMYDEAASLLENVLASGNRASSGEASYTLGMVYMRTGNLTRAESRMNEALRFARSSGNKELEALSLGGLGDLFNHKLEADKASYFLIQAVEIFKEIGNIRGLFSIWITLSNTKRNSEDGDSALEYSRNALECADILKGDLYMALARIAVAEALELQGEYRQALDNAVESVKLFKNINAKWGIQASCRTRATLESSLDMIDESIRSMEESIAVSEEIGGTYNSMEIYIAGGELFEKNGDTHRAIDLFTRAEKIARHLEVDKYLKELGEKLASLTSQMGTELDSRVRIHCEVP